MVPMRVIRIGDSSQGRISQACDRCRSKKVKCDGKRAQCTPCAHVGFECKTSDKLSRRAFPRGYTESLEDKVRHLEAEVRELKDLVDEKEERIDVLSRLYSLSVSSQKKPASSSHLPSERERSDIGGENGTVLVHENPLSAGSFDSPGGHSCSSTFDGT
jgi:hypothetical protein